MRPGCKRGRLASGVGGRDHRPSAPGPPPSSGDACLQGETQGARTEQQQAEPVCPLPPGSPHPPIRAGPWQPRLFLKGGGGKGRGWGTHPRCCPVSRHLLAWSRSYGPARGSSVAGKWLEISGAEAYRYLTLHSPCQPEGKMGVSKFSGRSFVLVKVPGCGAWPTCPREAASLCPP